MGLYGMLDVRNSGRVCSKHGILWDYMYRLYMYIDDN